MSNDRGSTNLHQGTWCHDCRSELVHTVFDCLYSCQYVSLERVCWTARESMDTQSRYAAYAEYLRTLYEP